MYYPRKGQITAEMYFVAPREGVEPIFVRDEAAARRAIVPTTGR